ncbi:major capsid protein [Escherichia coli]|uniref:major capsid protein n=1 Tax=Escherichia coli TaxID=562 RepID=UPI0018319E27|nr:major capsid protein [Escherichia coli]EFM6520591.1 major capsid protein [Escherichia coli]EIV9095341.1 major capsid protein [Escherichia coli]HCL9682432.1 major capsid protein [Escherichia coli]
MSIIANGFEVVDLTGVINKFAPQYGLLNKLGIFRDIPIATTTAQIDVSSQGLTLANSVARGSRNATTIAAAVIKSTYVPTPYFKIVDSITPEQIQNARQPGYDIAETVTRLTAERVTALRRKIDSTHEFMKLQALKGKTVTPEGKTLLDAYSAFDATQNDITFDFSGTGIDVQIQILKDQLIEDSGLAGVVDTDAVIVLCSNSFFNALTTNSYLRDAYLSQQNPLAHSLMTGSLATGISDGVRANSDQFVYRGMTFIRYPAKFTDATGAIRKGIEDDTALAFIDLRGVSEQSIFQNLCAPADKINFANTIGQPSYLFQFEDLRGDAVDFELHSAVTPFCSRPSATATLKLKK